MGAAGTPVPRIVLDTNVCLDLFVFRDPLCSHLLSAMQRGAVQAVALWLLLGKLFWVHAYDTEYAMVDRDDDLKIGIKTSAITLGRYDVAAVMAFYALFVATWAVVGARLGLGAAYFIGLGAAALIACWHYTLIRGRTRDGCFRAFRLNHWVGFAIFAGVVVATWQRG